MKLGIIGAPEAKTLVHAKELGLDFVEFDLNPPEFFGRPGHIMLSAAILLLMAVQYLL